MSRKTPFQVLQGYKKRLVDREQWLYEKIELLKKNDKPHGYELEEFYAISWILEFIAGHTDIVLEHITSSLQQKTDRKNNG